MTQQLIMILMYLYKFSFLLVDRVLEYNQRVSTIAVENVTINYNFFPSHFCERPIMPGVIMVEVFSFSYYVNTECSLLIYFIVGLH